MQQEKINGVQYSGTLDQDDDAIVYYNTNSAIHKNILLMSFERIKQGFVREDIMLFSDKLAMLAYLRILYGANTVLAFLTSGRFRYTDYNSITCDFNKIKDYSD